MIVVPHDEIIVSIIKTVDCIRRTPCEWTKRCPRNVTDDGWITCSKCPAADVQTTMSRQEARDWWTKQ